MIAGPVAQLGEALKPAAERFGFADLVRFDLAAVSPLAWLGVLVLAAYLAGVVALRARGKHWSVARTFSFVLGSAAWIAATGLTVNAQAGTLVSALLFQQLTLMVVVPPFLLMGSPGRLLLRATPHRGAGRVLLRAALSAYRSKGARGLLHPAVAILIGLLAFPGLYFTDALSVILAIPGGHVLLLALFLVGGIVAGAPLWSLDPLPRAPSYAARLADVIIEIQIHAVFGLVMLFSSEPRFRAYPGDPTGWDISRALDQAIAGGLAWSYGELPLLIVLVVTLSKWRSRELSTARHREAQEDAELEEYNALLAARQREADQATTRSRRNT